MHGGVEWTSATRRFVALLLPTLLVTQNSAALFEDQAGKWDWRQSYVGAVKFLETDAASSSGGGTGLKRVFVATRDNAVAAINARTGHLHWRHLYNQGDLGTIHALLGGALSYSPGVVTVSGAAQPLVRCWHKEKGHLLWETVLALPERSSGKSTSFFVTALFADGHDYTKNVVLVFSHAVTVLNLESGSVVWTHHFDAAETPIAASALAAPGSSKAGEEEGFAVLTVEPRKRAFVKFFDSQTGDIDEVRELAADWIPSDGDVPCAIDAAASLLCFDRDARLLRFAALRKQSKFLAKSLEFVFEGDDLIEVISPMGINSGLFQMSLSSGDRSVVAVNADGLVPIVARASSPSTLVAFGDARLLLRVESRLAGADPSGDKDVDGAATTHPYVLKFADAKTGDDRPDLEKSLDLAGWRGDAKALVGVAFSSKKDATAVSFRLVASMTDYSLLLVTTPGRAAWIREEALASVLSVAMVDLPISKVQAALFQDQNGGKKDDVLTAFVKRISMQVDQFVTFMYFLQDKFRVRLPPARDAQGRPVRREHSSSSSLSSSSSSSPTRDIFDPNPPDMELVRDEFGLRKIIVVSTASSKLIGLDSDTGYVIWQRYLPRLRPFDSSATGARPFGATHLSISPLFVLRTSAHVSHDPLCVVLGKSPTTGEGVAFEFNPLTGEPTGADADPDGFVPLGFMVAQATLLDAAFPSADDHVRGVLFLDSYSNVRVRPASLKTDLKDHLASYYMYTCDAVKGKLEGFAIDVDSPEWKAKRVWNVKIHPRLGAITRVVGRPPGEQTHSQGRVLADRSVMYKYLNPNLVAVVTEGEDDSVNCEGTPALQCFRGQISVLLIDVITGHIVFSTVHKKCRGPVNIVHSENWLVYTYWNERSRRNEIASIELYEGKTQSNTTIFSSLDLPLVTPMVERQSFIFPGHVDAMGVSMTEKGIANKDILLSLATGGLLELPRLFLDPRRPVEPRPEDREEGLIPYAPELPIPPISIVSYNQTIHRARGIASAPAGLESTSLVLVHGMDLFFTRIYPSKMFDLLKDDFDYFFISSVLFGLVAASFLFQQLAANKTVRRAWR